MSGMVRCVHYRNISTPTQFLCSNCRDQLYLPLKASTNHCNIRHRVPESFDQRKPFQDETVPIQVHQRPRRPGGALIIENNSPRFRRTKVSKTLLQPWLPSQFPLVSLPTSFYAGRLSTPSRPPVLSSAPYSSAASASISRISASESQGYFVARSSACWSSRFAAADKSLDCVAIIDIPPSGH